MAEVRRVANKMIPVTIARHSGDILTIVAVCRVAAAWQFGWGSKMVSVQQDFVRPGSVVPEHPAGSKMVLKTSSDTFRIVDLADDTCLVEVGGHAPMRGFADIYDGQRLVEHCLIMGAEIERGLMRCAFKQRTRAREHPPRDFAL
jgi:hypothetical protein